jgi:hypothetical protein
MVPKAGVVLFWRRKAERSKAKAKERNRPTPLEKSNRQGRPRKFVQPDLGAATVRSKTKMPATVRGRYVSEERGVSVPDGSIDRGVTKIVPRSLALLGMTGVGVTSSQREVGFQLAPALRVPGSSWLGPAGTSRMASRTF